jgi:radical SAM superfamily enzyme YgiQ (UPF0313 family)
MTMMKALLVHPEFSPFGFWNYKDVCRLVGAKYPASPLGLITMAALLPREWEIRLVDMNANPLPDSTIDWADLVFIGGMLPQQPRFLELIDRVHARGKKVVAGGPSPTSQPHVYEKADYLVLGEAERSIPDFLEALEHGAESGTFVPAERPPMASSPVPRFDLLNLSDYVMIGVQFSRGCPYSCEFCDIIELYGRVPRTKAPEQVVAELEALYRLGYRGHVDFVDDNFIGHRKKAKEILRAVREWSERHGHPFYFSTEASLNLADDEELLDLMADLDFRYVFVGIESPDPMVLKSAKKTTNLNRNIVNDLHKIYRKGIVVNAGFILGFDHETRESADHMVDLIRDGKICLAMVGLLYALPNTQLTRRLRREGRLLDDFDTFRPAAPSDVDQVSSGINFVTKRPRAEVIHDFLSILGGVYSSRDYFDRCLQVSRALKIRTKYKPSVRRMFRYARGFLMTVARLGLRPSTAWYYWRNLGVILLTRPRSVETVVNLMAMYIHFHKQAAFITEVMHERLRTLEPDRGGEDRTVPRVKRAQPSAVKPS